MKDIGDEILELKKVSLNGKFQSGTSIFQSGTTGSLDFEKLIKSESIRLTISEREKAIRLK